MAPGSLTYVGDSSPAPVKLHLISFSASSIVELENPSAEAVESHVKKGAVTWLQVAGLADTGLIRLLGEIFHIHPLTLEDILDTTQRPKVDETDGYLFVLLKTLRQDADSREISPEQISLVLGPNFLVSFQETQTNLFEPMLTRLRSGLGRIRKSGPDYLMYSVMDVVVDNYFVILEKVAETIESLEEELVTHPGKETLNDLHKLKTDMIYLRRSIWPLREIVVQLTRGEMKLIQESTQPYLRDVYDHTIHAIDSLETYRDILSGMLDIYLTSVNNRLSEIMKVLTIIATIFIPLTFLSGWYGMNFKHMPELDWVWGYPMIIAVAVSVVIGMLLFFRRKGWI